MTYAIWLAFASLVVCVGYPILMSRRPAPPDADAVVLKTIEERMRDSQC